MLAAADVYDALTSGRTYRKSVPPGEALGALEAEAQKGRLEREVVRALRSALLRNRALRTA